MADVNDLREMVRLARLAEQSKNEPPPDIAPSAIVASNDKPISPAPIVEKVENKIECECCDALVKESAVKHFKTLRLCQECYDKEVALTNESEANADKRVLDYRTQANLVEQVRDEAKNANIGKYEDFFNAEGTDLALIEGSPFERAEKIRERIDNWGALLFEVQVKRNRGIVELNQIAANLRKEEREKLRIQNIEYEPKEVVVKAKSNTPRLSKEDKAIQTMAVAMFGKKMAMGDNILKEIHKGSPEWFGMDGLVKAQYQDQVNDLVLARGGMTLETALQRVKDTVRNSRAITFQNIAEGKKV